LFLIASFFILPQAHTPTMFYAYFGALFLYLTTLALVTRQDFRRALGLLAATLVLNAFWFLPHLYFVFNHSSEISQSKIHHLFSEEAFLQNQEFGRIQDVAVLKNFLFNWGEHVGEGQFGDLLDEWKQHLDGPYVGMLGYAYFVFVVIGFLLAMAGKNKFGVGLFSVTIFGLFFLMNDNPPFGWLFNYLQTHSSLFKEAFRFPFTKFSILLILSYAAFFSYALASISDFIEKSTSRYRSVAGFLFYFVFVTSLFYYARPMLDGYLISPSMRVNIPHRYFELFEHMDKQNEYGRVANLPIDSFWGWAYYDWDSTKHIGYQGAGFLWFGIKQPLLNREFDRWDILNEQYYREMATAIYSQDSVALKKVLDKYKIRWILLDESIIAPGADNKSLFYTQTKTLFKESGFLMVEKDFGDGLNLYKYNPETPFSTSEIIGKFVYSDDSIFKENDDPIYKQYGNYVSDDNSNYPYLGITNFTESLKKEIVSSDSQYLNFANKISDSKLLTNDDSVQFTASFTYTSANKATVQISPVQSGIVEAIPNIEFDVTGTDYVVVINDELPMVASNSYVFNAKSSDNIKLSLYKLNPLNIDYTSLIERCSGVEGGSSYGIEYSTDGFTLLAKDVTSCVTLRLSTLLPITPKLVAVRSNLAENGALAGVCVFDEAAGLCRNRPFVSNTAAAILDTSTKDYLLRFLAYNVGKKANVEGSVTFGDVRLFTGTEVLSKSLNIVRTQGLNPASVFKFRKDPAFSGLATSLLSAPRLCDGAETNFERSFVDTNGGEFITYESHGESLCDSFQMPFVSHNTGSILEVTSRNREGLPIRICLTNEFSKRCDLYVSLSTNKEFETAYYMIPPMDNGRGYTVNLSNLVFGEGESVNDLKYIALTPIPYNFFRSIHQEPRSSAGENLYVLNEAYEVGWVAFCGYLPCRADHVMVNNWSNGWIFSLEVPSNIRVLFLPQLLQYLGFALLPLVFIRIKK
jgi:hypothetical protein